MEWSDLVFGKDSMSWVDIKISVPDTDTDWAASNMGEPGKYLFPDDHYTMSSATISLCVQDLLYREMPTCDGIF